MVPELSCKPELAAIHPSGQNPEQLRGIFWSAYLVKLHKSLPQSVYLFSVDCEYIMVRIEPLQDHQKFIEARGRAQFDPWTIPSSTWLVVFPIL